jgi:hypothetical protein
MLKLWIVGADRGADTDAGPASVEVRRRILENRMIKLQMH